MIKEKFKEVFDIIKQECFNHKELNESQVKKIQELFHIEEINPKEILYNDFNIIFLSQNSYNQLSYLLSENDITLKIEMPEYSEIIAIYRYVNDNILNEILA